LGLVECWVWIVLGYKGETCELCLVLATGVRAVSSVWSGYKGETGKPVALGYSWVTKVLSTLCTHTFPISCILICFSEEGEYFDEDFF
jgi:hypothetical protein